MLGGAAAAVVNFDAFAGISAVTGTTGSSTDDTLETNAVSWAAGDTLLITLGYACSGALTLSSITSSAATDPTFSQVELAHGDDGGGNLSGLLIAHAVATASGSSDTFTVTMSGSMFGRACSVVVIPRGTAVRQSTSGTRGASGTEIVLTLSDVGDGSILPTSLMVAAGSRRGGGSEFTDPSGMAEHMNESPGSQNRTTAWSRYPGSSGGNGSKTVTVAGIGNPAAAAYIELTRP